MTGPHNVLGIELNEYAAELARVTVWIGELQWRLAHGYEFKTNPVLDTLEHIECRDALLAEGGTEAAWPAADVVVGNPQFLGARKCAPNWAMPTPPNCAAPTRAACPAAPTWCAIGLTRPVHR